MIPEGTCSLSINAQRGLCSCCWFFAAVFTAAHICYRTEAVGLVDWKSPAGSDLGALAVREEPHSEPVVMQRLGWYRWLWGDSHLHSCWSLRALKKNANPYSAFMSGLQIKVHNNPLGSFERCGTSLRINPCKDQNRDWRLWLWRMQVRQVLGSRDPSHLLVFIFCSVVTLPIFGAQ